jgi:hypothetical protein
MTLVIVTDFFVYLVLTHECNLITLPFIFSFYVQLGYTCKLLNVIVFLVFIFISQDVLFIFEFSFILFFSGLTYRI